MWCVAWLQARELQQLTGSSEVCSTAALTAGPLTACVPACLPGYSGLGPDKNTTELGQTWDLRRGPGAGHHGTAGGGVWCRAGAASHLTSLPSFSLFSPLSLPSRPVSLHKNYLPPLTGWCVMMTTNDRPVPTPGPANGSPPCECPHPREVRGLLAGHEVRQ